MEDSAIRLYTIEGTKSGRNSCLVKARKTTDDRIGRELFQW